jgi:hypothetical protein
VAERGSEVFCKICFPVSFEGLTLTEAESLSVLFPGTLVLSALLLSNLLDDEGCAKRALFIEPGLG